MLKTKIKNIFHPSDFTEGDEAAWIHALKIALLIKGKLRLLHVSETEREIEWSEFPHVRATLVKWGFLDDQASRDGCAKLGLDVSKITRKDHDPVKAITHFIKKHKQDLVVLSTHQRQGMLRWFSESISEPIARTSQKMTLVVPRRVMGFVSYSTGEIRIRNVLIPIENSISGTHAVNDIIEIIQDLGCGNVKFTLLHVGSTTDFPTVDAPKDERWEFNYLMEKGNIVENILTTADDINADLIVMATHGGKEIWDSINGSTTERVTRSTNCPVWIMSQVD